MDSRDSTQSTAVNSSGDDDGVLSVTATLAKEAALYFQSRKFDECLDLLKQLLEKKPNDPKVISGFICRFPAMKCFFYLL